MRQLFPGDGDGLVVELSTLVDGNAGLFAVDDAGGAGAGGTPLEAALAEGGHLGLVGLSGAVADLDGDEPELDHPSLAEGEIDRAPTAGHRTWLSGRDVGQVPFRIDGAAARLLLIRLVFRVAFYRVLTTSTPLGRKLRPKLTGRGMPLVRVRAGDLAAAGIQRAPRVVGTRDGMPLLEDGRVLEVANVIWCSGFHHGFSWIDLPVLGERDEPLQRRGIVGDQPGLYFVGLHFLYAASSAMIHGVGRDAGHVVDAIAARPPRYPRPGVGPADLRVG